MPSNRDAKNFALAREGRVRDTDREVVLSVRIIVGDDDIFEMLHVRDGLGVVEHALLVHVYDARGAQDIPLGVERGRAGKARGVLQREGRLEAITRNDP